MKKNFYLSIQSKIHANHLKVKGSFCLSFLFVFILTSISWNASATSYFVVSSGSWAQGTPTALFSTTSCGGAAASLNPTSVDNIEICSGVSLTLSGTCTLTNVIVDDGGTLSLAGFAFTVSGTTT